MRKIALKFGIVIVQVILFLIQLAYNIGWLCIPIVLLTLLQFAIN